MSIEEENEILKKTVARLERKLASVERAHERLDKMLVASNSVGSNLLNEQARFLAELEEKTRALRDREQALRSALDRIQEDLQESRAFQEALLPVPLSDPRIQFAASYKPAEEVGGDLYDVSLSGGKLRIFLGDTTGHGVQAALRTIVVRTLLARHQDARSPAELLTALNGELVATHGRLVRLSACCVELDLRTDPPRLTYANAAAPPVLLFADGAIAEIYTAGPFLGLLEDETWTERTIELPGEYRLFFYTDGLFDQWNAAGEALEESRVIAELSAFASIEACVERAVRAAEDFRGAVPQPDDVTVLGLASVTRLD
jgi:serine phosphatase RsbU (regulator of sigma subunit)